MQELYNKPVKDGSILKIEGISSENHLTVDEQNYLSALKITVGEKALYIHGCFACGAVIVNSKESLDEIARKHVFKEKK